MTGLPDGARVPLTVVPAAVRTPTGWHAAVDLPLDPRATASARRTACHLLRSWGTEGALLDDVALVVSELVGNAVRHGGERVRLELALEGDIVEVAVVDGSAAVPQQRRADDPEAEGGRGIAIVAALSTHWGVQEQPGGGKRVYARLAG